MSLRPAARQVPDLPGISAERWRHAWETRRRYHSATIRFYRPTRTLPISLTGEHCALNCAHCGGHYLQHMHALDEVAGSEATSCLISGGCDAQGRVPVAPHVADIARLCRGRRLNWHLGFIEEETMQRIAPLIDVISFDIVGDAQTAREVYGLDVDLPDYVRTLKMLRRHAKVVPHLTIGLRGGRLSGELAALEALRPLNLEALIFIILIPTPGTAYAQCDPPAPADVVDIWLTAREMMPRTQLTLGCMRPHGAYRRAVDELAVHAGLNGIVNPTRHAQKAAKARGLRADWGDECCALP